MDGRHVVQQIGLTAGCYTQGCFGTAAQIHDHWSIGVRCKQDVGRFDVTVRKVLGMNGVDALANATKQGFGVLFGTGGGAWNGVAVDEVLESAPGAIGEKEQVLGGTARQSIVAAPKQWEHIGVHAETMHFDFFFATNNPFVLFANHSLHGVVGVGGGVVCGVVGGVVGGATFSGCFGFFHPVDGTESSFADFL